MPTDHQDDHGPQHRASLGAIASVWKAARKSAQIVVPPRMLRRTAAGLVVLGTLSAIVVIGIGWRAWSIVDRLVRDWASTEVATQSGGVYVLNSGPIHFDWRSGGFDVDSIAFFTKGWVNQRRAQPLPALRVSLVHCTLAGVRIVELVAGGGISASSLGCLQGSFTMIAPRPAVGSAAERGRPVTVPPTANTFALRRSVLEQQQQVRLPRYAPKIAISRIEFPELIVDVRLPRLAGGTVGLRLGVSSGRWTISSWIRATPPRNARSSVGASS